MKKAVLVLVVSMVSSIAFAQQRIDLMAGSSVRLNAGQVTVVTCEGGSQGAGGGSSCTIESENGTLYIKNNGKFVTYRQSLADALQVIKSMREAGLCN